MFTSDDRKRLTEAIGLALESGSTFSWEYRLVRPNNDIRWVSLGEGRQHNLIACLAASKLP